MTPSAWKKFGLTAVLGLATLAGCSAFESDSDKDRDSSDRVSRSRRDEDVVLSGDRDVDRDRDAATKVPKDARVVDSGSGSLSYSARYDGSVYLYDEDARTVVWDARLRDGDRVSVDPDRNRIELNGRSGSNIDLKSGHRFRLYFLEGLKSERSTRSSDRYDRDRF
jgi:hypothetical protein